MHRQLDVGTRQLGERRADRSLARRRDEGERIAFCRRIRLEAIQPDWSAGLQIRRKQIDFPIRRIREHVDELHRRDPERRRRLRAGAQVAADGSGQMVEHVDHQIELPCRLVVFPQIEARAELAEYVRVRPRFADGVDDRPSQLEADRPVRLREIVTFEKRGRG